MKVFAGGILTETNTFSPMPTGMVDFEASLMIRAKDLPKDGDIGGLASTIDVFRNGCQERGWEFIFGLYTFAQPAGITVRPVYESLRDELLESLKSAMPVDIVLLPLHGAMVADGYDDCETDIIQHVRDIVGPDTKIGVELDLHCDVTQQMIEQTDAIVIYKEYPHIDIADRAEDLFQIIADASEGKTKPTMALYDCRMIGLYYTPVEPMRSFVDEMMAAEGNDGILSLSLAHCFPWADVPTNSAYMLVITDDDTEQATQLAEEWGQKFFRLRHQLELSSLPLDEALDKSLAIDTFPVVVADQSDNAGGGAPSDSTFVLKALLDRKIDNVAIAMIWDPIVVRMATSAGIGATLDVRLGGKMGPMSGDPLDLRVTVIGIIKDMKQEWPQTEGVISVPCGDSVALHCNGIDIVVNSLRSQVLSTQVFSNFGIDLLQKRVLIVKSMQHFYAAFEPIASEIIYMATSGSVAPLFRDIPFKRIDKNKYPWVDNPFA
jgi:microcystin degradation protein MlrC